MIVWLYNGLVHLADLWKTDRALHPLSGFGWVGLSIYTNLSRNAMISGVQAKRKKVFFTSRESGLPLFLKELVSLLQK